MNSTFGQQNAWTVVSRGRGLRMNGDGGFGLGINSFAETGISTGKVQFDWAVRKGGRSLSAFPPPNKSIQEAILPFVWDATNRWWGHLLGWAVRSCSVVTLLSACAPASTTRNRFFFGDTRLPKKSEELMRNRNLYRAFSVRAVLLLVHDVELVGAVHRFK